MTITTAKVGPLPTMDLHRSERVLSVVLNWAAELNCLTEQCLAELESVLALAEEDRSLRVLSITGTGKAFCVRSGH